jgi:acetylornithine deacetylase/succinyl-diaminopimelate desuccinylase-like protein
MVGVPYWTDAATLVNRAKTPTCLFGPGNIEVAHSKNEHVKVEDVLKASKVYAKTAIEYCSVVDDA